jgi:hypothetical protein
MITQYDDWKDIYYRGPLRPIGHTYPPSFREDKGEKAFKIIKALMDKKLVQIEKIEQFIDLMDELIKIL